MPVITQYPYVSYAFLKESPWPIFLRDVRSFKAITDSFCFYKTSTGFIDCFGRPISEDLLKACSAVAESFPLFSPETLPFKATVLGFSLRKTLTGTPIWYPDSSMKELVTKTRQLLYPPILLGKGQPIPKTKKYLVFKTQSDLARFFDAYPPYIRAELMS